MRVLRMAAALGLTGTMRSRKPAEEKLGAHSVQMSQFEFRFPTRSRAFMRRRHIVGSYLLFFGAAWAWVWSAEQLISRIVRIDVRHAPAQR